MSYICVCIREIHLYAHIHIRYTYDKYITMYYICNTNKQYYMSVIIRAVSSELYYLKVNKMRKFWEDGSAGSIVCPSLQIST